MGTPLTALQIGSSFSGLLKTTDNAIINGTLRTISDGMGTDSALQVSTAGIASTGTLAVTGPSSLHRVDQTDSTISFSSTVNTGVSWQLGTNNNYPLDVFTNGVVRGTFSSTGLALLGGLSATTGINSTAIGAVTPSTGAFTTGSFSGALTAASAAFAGPLSATGEVTLSGAIFRTTAAFSNAGGTSLTAIPGLSVNITNAGVYLFSGNLYVDNGDGYKLDFSGTSTASAFVAGVNISAEATAAYQGVLGAYAASKTYPAGGYTASIASITGTLVCSGTGTFIIRFAQVSGGGTSSVRIGSNLSVRRIS